MDRLFRTEIEGDERERARESALDVAPYLARPVEMPDEPQIELEETAAPPPRRRGWLIGAAAAAAVAAVAATVFLGTRGAGAPAPPPTPTAEEIAAQRQAQGILKQHGVQGRSFIFSGTDPAKLVEALDPSWRGAIRCWTPV